MSLGHHCFMTSAKICHKFCHEILVFGVVELPIFMSLIWRIQSLNIGMPWWPYALKLSSLMSCSSANWSKWCFPFRTSPIWRETWLDITRRMINKDPMSDVKPKEQHCQSWGEDRPEDMDVETSPRKTAHHTQSKIQELPTMQTMHHRHFSHIHQKATPSI